MKKIEGNGVLVEGRIKERSATKEDFIFCRDYLVDKDGLYDISEFRYQGYSGANAFSKWLEKVKKVNVLTSDYLNRVFIEVYNYDDE